VTPAQKGVSVHLGAQFTKVQLLVAAGGSLRAAALFLRSIDAVAQQTIFWAPCQSLHTRRTRVPGAPLLYYKRSEARAKFAAIL
jgi:hypothetical protein